MMTNSNNATLLAALGISMGLSADDMHDIIVDTRESLPNNEPTSPLEEVADTTKDMDTKTLFIGALLYGYILDTYDGIGVSAAVNDDS